MKKGVLCLVCLLLISGLLAGCGKKPADTAVTSSAGASVLTDSAMEASSAAADTSIGTSLPASQAGGSVSPAASSPATSSSSRREEPSVPPAVPEPVTDQPPVQPVSQPDDPDPARIAVTLSVDCRTAVEAGYADAVEIAADGVILSDTQVLLEEGATVYELLMHSGLDVEIDSSLLGRYVKEIQFLQEKQCGGASGWMYSVNGVFPGKAMDKYKLKDGDKVAWRYTCQNGSDLS